MPPVAGSLAVALRAVTFPLAAAIPAFAVPLPLDAGQDAWQCPDPASLTGGLEGEMAHVRYLADDLLEGRAVATRGERCAGDYIAARFRELGLRPAGDAEGYFQAWMVRTGSALGEGNEFALSGDSHAESASGGDTAAEFTLGDDWIPYGFSASTRAGAPMTLVPALGGAQAGDAAHAGLAGRALVIEGTAARPHTAPPDAHRVASSAAAMGAAALIVLLGPSDPLPALDAERRAALAIPVIAVRGDAADRVRTAAASGAAATIATAVDPVRREARNVAALLPGSDPHGGQTLVIGAHYDHVGFGGAGSLSPNALGQVHNGADDDWELVNAGGMARVTGLVTAVVREVVPAAGSAALTPVEGAGNPHGMQGPTDGSTVRRGFRVRLGTIPDYSRESGGMAITGVRDGSPAARAGLMGGDIIVKLGPHDIEDVYGYMYALGEFEPGEKVEVVVLRDGKRMVFEVVPEGGGG